MKVTWSGAVFFGPRVHCTLRGVIQLVALAGRRCCCQRRGAHACSQRQHRRGGCVGGFGVNQVRL